MNDYRLQDFGLQWSMEDLNGKEMELEAGNLMEVDADVTRISFILLIRPVSWNAFYRTTIGGKWYTTMAAQAFKAEVNRQLNHLFPDGNHPRINGKVSLRYEFHLAGKREIDIENMQKPLTDVLKDIFFGDDELVYEEYSNKTLNCDRNYVKVVITQYKE